MKRIALFCGIVFLTTLSACVQPTAAIAPLADELSGRRAAPARSPAELRAAYERLLAALIPGMGAVNIPEREAPSQMLERVCYYAGRPDAEAERAALSAAMAAHLGDATPRPARVWLLRQLERIGGDEAVAAEKVTLAERDAEIRDLARRALQKNPSPRAAEALRAALEQADDPTWQRALLLALGARRDEQSLPLLVARVRHTDGAVASAALAALGDIGTPEALTALERQWLPLTKSATPELRAALGDALVRAADSVAAAGGAERAAASFEKLWGWTEDGPDTLRAAALRGLVATRGAQQLPLLLQTLADAKVSEELRAVAGDLTTELPGSVVTAALAQALPTAEPAAAALLLRTLGARGDAVARPAVMAQLSSTHANVRLAAVRALQRVGDRQVALALAQIAAEGNGEEQEAARLSLARLSDEGVDATVLAGLPNTTGGVRAELIRALAARRCDPALPLIVEEARHPDEVVRIAAFKALGELARVGDAPTLLKLLPATEPEAVESAAEDAVVTVCCRDSNAERRTAPVLACWAEASPGTRQKLVHVLGRLGGPAALETIRQTRKADNAALADAAIRALAKWQTIDALDDLLDIAQHAENQTHRILALQGFVRLLGLPSDREPQRSLELYQTALKLAERPDERRLVLGGLGEVRNIEALRTIERFLDDDALRGEAEAAAVSSAQLIGPFDPEVAHATIERVRAQTKSDTTRKRCQEVVDALQRAEGCLVAWQWAGPYFDQGKDWLAVYAQAYPPERDDPRIEWRPLPITTDKRPWVFDLTKLDPGSDRCVYVRCAVWSPKAQPAQLLLGSDDALRVWLNGRSVYEFKQIRGHDPLKDKAACTLKSGWNTLLLKVVQCSGGWGFSCAVKAPDGSPLSGLRAQPVSPDWR